MYLIAVGEISPCPTCQNSCFNPDLPESTHFFKIQKLLFWHIWAVKSKMLGLGTVTFVPPCMRAGSENLALIKRKLLYE